MLSPFQLLRCFGPERSNEGRVANATVQLALVHDKIRAIRNAELDPASEEDRAGRDIARAGPTRAGGAQKDYPWPHAVAPHRG